MVGGGGASLARKYIGACDGGCQDGSGVWAYVIRDSEGNLVAKDRKRMPNETTNNRAEYTAAIALLETANRLKLEGTMVVYSDSKLLVNQIGGSFKVKVAELKPLRAEAVRLIDGMLKRRITISFVWVPRDNQLIKECDALGREV